MDSKNSFVSFSVIGNNVRKARNKTNMTQNQVAEKLEISEVHYGRLERGERKASLEQLAQTAHVLGVSISALLDGCIVHESFEIMPNDTAQALGNAIADLSRGCSPQTHQMMFKLCQMLAQGEKLRNERN